MKTLGTPVVLTLLSFQITYTQPEIEAKFLYRAQPYAGGTLPYRLFVPEHYDSTAAYPLVMTLHGNGGQGTNGAQINGTRMATAWADPVNQTQHPCFVVAPQCPLGIYDWYDVNTTLDDIIDSLARAYSIDTNRLYITGLSMGGVGTWEMITLYPGRFAAAVPVSGGGDPDWLYSFGDIPIWNFHGALDVLVPPLYSRVMFAAMEEHGRTAVYTHCLGFECDGLPDSVIALHVANHADLLYTETAMGEHNTNFFDGSYNYKYLIPWVFDKHRLTPGIVSITNPATVRTFTGTAALTWSGGMPDDSVELWFSPDAGRSWRIIEHSVPNTGAYSWATNGLPDCALGLINIFLKETTGHIYGRAQSAFFAIDNAGNGVPSVSLVRDPRIVLQFPFVDDTLTIPFRVADPEGDSTKITISYSTDRGSTFTDVESLVMPSDPALHPHVVQIGSLANSDQAILRVTASDGLRSGADRTGVFLKRSARKTGPRAERTQGFGGTLTVNIVDANRLTGQLYRIIVTDTVEGKWYDVFNTDTGVKVVSQATVPFDGTTEGPLFDGIRLVLKDYRPAQVDAGGTRWEIGSSPYQFTISLPVIDMGGYTLTGFAYPADYTITISDAVVDTSSSAIFGAERIPMRFAVRNTTEDRKAEVVYLDGDSDRKLSPLDEIYILEPDSQGNPQLTWGLIVQTSSKTDPPPVPGDSFLFKTLKPVRSGDTFEFRGNLVSVRDKLIASSFRLDQNYPNPFNPSTTISFTVGTTGVATLEIFNILGQQVGTLFSGVAVAGQRYQVIFDGNNLATGVYFYRLRAGSFAQVRKFVLLK